MIEIGRTRPFRVYCNNGLDLTVMKCQNESTNGKALFNELIGFRLAKALSLPVPSFDIAWLPQKIIDYTSDLCDVKAQAGHCFISEWIRGVTGGLPTYMKYASNKEDFPGILFFDQLLMNVDRGENRGNWMFEKKTKKIMIFDFEAIFRIAQIWDKNSLKQDMNTPPVLLKELDESLYKNLIGQIKTKHAFSKIERSVKNLSKDTKKQIFDGIPDDWKISRDDQLAAREFVYFQLDHYQDIINLLSNKFKL